MFSANSGRVDKSVTRRRQPTVQAGGQNVRPPNLQFGPVNSGLATRPLKGQGGRGGGGRHRRAGRHISRRQPAEEMKVKENGEDNIGTATGPLKGQGGRGGGGRHRRAGRHISRRQPAEEMNDKKEEKKMKTENGEDNLDMATRPLQGQGLQGSGGGRFGQAEEMPNEKNEDMKIKTEMES